jgi:hypothetical protein
MQYPYFIIVFMPQRIHVSKTKGARFENQPSARNNNAFAMEMGKTSYAQWKWAKHRMRVVVEVVCINKHAKPFLVALVLRLMVQNYCSHFYSQTVSAAANHNP